MQMPKFNKELFKESAIVTAGLIVVGSFIAPLLSSVTSGFGLTITGLPTYQTLFTGGIFSVVGLYIGVLLSLVIAKVIANATKKF